MQRTTLGDPTYFASNAVEQVLGLNFALQRPTNKLNANCGADGVGAKPERLEATARVRVNDRHNLEVSVGGMQFNSAFATEGLGNRPAGQFTVRAVDEWIVRNGVVIVMGLDYSRFIGAGGARSLSPRIGVQLTQSRTRVKSAYAPGVTRERRECCEFEGNDVVLLIQGKRRSRHAGQAVWKDSRPSLESKSFSNDRTGRDCIFDTTAGRGVGLLRTRFRAPPFKRRRSY